MRALLLSRPAWSSSPSTKAAVVLCALNCCMINTSGGARWRVPLCGTVATCAVCRPSRLYSTTRLARCTRDGENSFSSNSVTTPEETNDDAMDLIWSTLPDPHEHHNEMTLTSGRKQHKPAMSVPETNPPPCEHSETSNANDTPESPPAPQPSYVWVSLHNMPRNWLHEDIVEMIHQVAEHAGITAPQATDAPSSALGQEPNDADDTDEGTSSALSFMASPLVRRLHIPFGRRTGIVYGSPKLLLTSPQLADHLTHSLTFDPDDFRSRIYFTRLKPEEVPRSYQEQQQLHGEDSAGSDPATGNSFAQVMYTPIEETVEREQDEALQTLELDRYLFAPDLLLDIAKARQRRLVTKREKVLLDAFVDGEEDSDEGEDGADEEDSIRGGDGNAEDGAEAVDAPVTRRRQPRRRASPSGGSTKRKKKVHPIGNVRAGTQKHLGRGSMHNMPIPKPSTLCAWDSLAAEVDARGGTDQCRSPHHHHPSVRACMSQMTTKKKKWGTKTAWSMSFFDMVPWAAEEEKIIGSTPTMMCSSSQGSTSAACSPASKAAGVSSANSPPHRNPGKVRKTQELDARTQWRCRRCGAMLKPPLDAATGKPRYGVMMTEHLEGVSSGGTTHLATGVVVCSAGTLQFKTTPGKESGVESAPPNKRHRDDLNEDSACGTPTMENVGDCRTKQTRREEESDGKMAARNALRRLLRHCQEAAQHHATSNDSPSPLLFIVVENPKTPANAGGILRAMRCYGVRGPGATTSDVAASLPSSAAQPSSVVGTAVCTSGGIPVSTPVEDASESAEESVLQRVGGFIFSGSRLEKAMAHSDYAHTLRTDPTHAGRDIPLHCVPTLDTLFDVLRDDHGYRQQEQSSSSTPLVRVVAVELVEGAVALPYFEHPFSRTPQPSSSQSTGKDGASRVDGVPMVFYLLGPEDGTISTHHVQHDVDEVVFVPTTGSMNLAASVNVLLYDRLAKECCGVRPGVAAATSTSDEKWKAVFKTRNANNRLRWKAPPPLNGEREGRLAS